MKCSRSTPWSRKHPPVADRVAVVVHQGSAHVDDPIGLAEQRALEPGDVVLVDVVQGGELVRLVDHEGAPGEGLDDLVAGRQRDHEDGAADAQGQHRQPQLGPHQRAGHHSAGGECRRAGARWGSAR